jgi:hypothetical protein
MGASTRRAILRRIQKLVRFAYREQQLLGQLRPQLGIRRAVASRVRANLELDLAADLERATLEAHAAALATHTAALESLPAMGRALEGLAARIDRLDAVTADRPAAEVAPEATVPPIPVPPRRSLAPRRGFPARDGRLRILGVNDMFPLISETYIRGELISLAQFGADIAWYRSMAVPAPMPVPEPVYDDFDQAIETMQPDLAMVHWVNTAKGHLHLFEQHQLPFGVRAHSVDFDRGELEELARHPLCVGIWTYPVDEFHVDGAHTLTPILVASDFPEDSAGPRDKVVSVSAGLPKKDWPLLLDALDRVYDVDRRLIVGITCGHEDNPTRLAQACNALGNPPLLQVNMVREDVLRLLSRTAVMIYTLVPEAPFGMPMSIADALCAGCSVIVPDRSDAIEYAGPNARPYRTADDIVAQVEEVLRGGPKIAQEWASNRELGLSRFCDPNAPRQFDAELRAGLDRVRGAVRAA